MNMWAIITILITLALGCAAVALWRSKRHVVESTAVSPCHTRAGTAKGSSACQQTDTDDLAKLRECIDYLLSGRKDGEIPAPLGEKDVEKAVMDRVIERAEKMKALAGTVRLYKVVNDPDAALSEVSRVVLADPVLSGKILRIANSAHFGLRTRTESVSHAIMLMGLSNIINILHSDRLLSACGNIRSQSYSALSLNRHAAFVSICSRYTGGMYSDLNTGTLFTMGILHDIGKYITAELEREGQHLQGNGRLSDTFREEQALGINHAMAGRILLRRWEIPETIARAVEMHHAPSMRKPLREDGRMLRYVVSLYLADQVAKVFSEGDGYLAEITPLDASYHDIVHGSKLKKALLDDTLLYEVRKAQAIMEQYAETPV